MPSQSSYQDSISRMITQDNIVMGGEATPDWAYNAHFFTIPRYVAGKQSLAGNHYPALKARFVHGRSIFPRKKYQTPVFLVGTILASTCVHVYGII